MGRRVSAGFGFNSVRADGVLGGTPGRLGSPKPPARFLDSYERLLA